MKKVHSSILKKNIKHEKEEGKYKCRICSRLFSYSLYLKRHYYENHSKQERFTFKIITSHEDNYVFRKKVFEPKNPLIINNVVKEDKEI